MLKEYHRKHLIVLACLLNFKLCWKFEKSFYSWLWNCNQWTIVL